MKWAIILCVLIIPFSIFSFVTRQIDSGWYGIKSYRGKAVDVLPPGFYTVNPLNSWIYAVDVKTKSLDLKTEAVTYDLNKIKLSLVANYSKDIKKLKMMFSKYEPDWNGDQVKPAILSNIQDVVSEKFMSEVIRNRRKIVKDALLRANKSLDKSGYYLESLYATELDFVTYKP